MSSSMHIISEVENSKAAFMGNRKVYMYAIAAVVVITIIGLLLALVILIAKTETLTHVVCDADGGNSATDSRGSVETAGGDAGNPVHEGNGLKVPDCELNAESATPELDKAKCILESYPLIDG